MTHVWRWRKTKYGPLHDKLQGRFGEPCRVVTRGKNGNLWVEFADGYRVVSPRYSVMKR